MKILISSFTASLLLASGVLAAPVDLSGWSVEQGPGAQPAGNWSLAPDNNSVTQTVNSQVSVFYDGAASSQGKALSGTIRVNTSFDDDFVGFVLGMDAGEVDGSAGTVDYWLVDWKQGNQTYLDTLGEAGLSLSHVTGSTLAEQDFWGHIGVLSEKKTATNLGATGWNDLQTYTFELIFTETLIEVSVDGVKEISYTSAEHGSLFKDGGFGFYNYSQGNVTYAGIEEEPAPPSTVPLPAGMPLLLAGLGGLGLLGHRKRS
ncbi:VPLPA-CTERM sorting domain-containing protein [Roseobacter sp. S98]|uniref:VPLPA-CTERM sorting domain-containing protein n=1 Tax=Roseobacter algicola (ex Choi et al. 2025) (nom. illeg.) TaxID=3092138 RepID=UPI0035C732D7